jgi:putative transposase
MQLVETHQISRYHKHFKECDALSRKTKLLYNEANYAVRQMFIKEKIYTNAAEMQKTLQGTANYTALPAKVASQTLRNLDKNWISFFAASKEFKKHPEKYKGKPHLPGYKKTHSIVIYDRQAISTKALRKGVIALSQTNIELEYQHLEHKVKQARIIPINSQLFKIEIVYDVPIGTVSKGKKQVGIDLGVNNLVTLAGEINPIIMEGKVVKSYNQWYNKEKARLQAKLPKGRHVSKRIEKLTNKRNNKITDYMHRASRCIVNYCLTNDVGTVVIGYNPEWKQGVNHGRRNNQNFVNIPFYRLVSQIEYKANMVGIVVKMQEESYTSKCSFLDNETIEHHKKHIGKRVRRGLFRSGTGIFINADVNGALNILRKSNLQSNEEIVVLAVVPVRINPYKGML